MTDTTGPMLVTRGLTKRFEGVVALSNLDLVVEKRAIAGLIGPNGAGKTTLFNVVTGFYAADEGEIELAGQTINRLAPHAVAALGLSRTFQNIRLFANMTALENVLVGRHLHAAFALEKTEREEDTGGESRSALASIPRRALSSVGVVWEVIATLARTPDVRLAERAAVERCLEVLAFVGLRGKHDELARNLPYGGQRRLELARALATNPRLLLLDEPTAGMNPHESQEIVGLIRSVRDDLGMTVLLIEHQMRVVMGVCEQITVLDYGEKIAEGPPEAVQRNKRVIEAYLGTRSIGIDSGAA